MNNLCKCGCGKETKPGRIFIHGHNWKDKHHSKNTKEKLSTIRLGKKHPMFGRKNPEHSRRMTGKNNPMKRPEQRARMRNRTGPNNPMWGKKRPEHSQRMKGNIFNRGKNNPNWRGGISFIPYSPEFNDELKRFIKDRDNNECQNPYCDHKVNKLIVHHIDYNKQNCKQFNLITICKSCNSKANFNRREWKRFYKKIIWSKY